MPRQKLTKAWVGHPKRPTCQATQKWSECQMTKSKAIHTISHDFLPKNDHVNKKWHCCLCKISSSNKICSQFVQKTIFIVVWLSDCSHQTRHPPWLPETFLGGRPTSLTSGRNGHHGWNYVSRLHKSIHMDFGLASQIQSINNSNVRIFATCDVIYRYFLYDTKRIEELIWGIGS